MTYLAQLHHEISGLEELTDKDLSSVIGGSVMINSHGTIINETGANSTNNQNGFNEDSFDEPIVRGSKDALRIPSASVTVPLQPFVTGFVAVPL